MQNVCTLTSIVAYRTYFLLSFCNLLHTEKKTEMNLMINNNLHQTVRTKNNYFYI